MIEKLAVRKMLASYERKLKNEINSIEAEIQKMNNVCQTNEMLEIWHQSKRYAELSAKKCALYNVYCDIMDMRCDEALED
jgi:hypothetical protein